ncbi:MAG: adenosylmethionine--8-amino-7-oxononanoate transaminase [Solirubrobacterales bacterium]|nr:adenosylmethionine--8-amino-7-oxononanoate transaminase [Solirubrobacterales bacterium]
MNAAALFAADSRTVWHPYAPLNGPSPYLVTGADGVRLSLTAPDGAEFEAIDAMSSWWCAIHGYRNPVLDAAARAQLDRFSHVMFGGLTHEPAVALAERLTTMTGLDHVFLADSGSVSVEVALKLAVQATGRKGFIALRGAYHGDTTGAMGVCDPEDGMHSRFPVTSQTFLARPPAFEAGEPEIAAWAAGAELAVAAAAERSAAIIVEPVLQGAGGMWMYAPECLRVLRRLADQHGLLLIFDEIATGFGRTGRMWGADWAGVAPDVMCVGKALTGGYMSLAAVLCGAHVADALGDTPLMHGPTFMGNPLACAVALASLDLVDVARPAAIGSLLEQALAPARGSVRVLGAVGVVQLCEPVDVARVTRVALEHGVWVRPFRDLVYTMPPYVCSDAEIAAIGAAICAAVA